MKYTNKFGFEYDVQLVTADYAVKNRKAIMLLDSDTGEQVATVTINLPDEELEKDEVFIKNHSENEGMLDFVREIGLVKKITGYVKSGFVKVPKVKLDLEKLEELRI